MLRRVIFMALAIIAASGTYMMVQSAKNTQSVNTVQVKQEEPKGPFVLVAAKTMPAGTFVTAENLKWQLWPKGALSESYMLKSNNKIEDLTGSVVRRAITQGEPLTSERIIKPGDRGFVAAILKDGMRAVSVQVNAQSGIAGLVFPGDQVDVLLTHAVSQPADENRPVHQVSETILKNVRVLAMDQKIDDTNAKPSIPKTATLEVTPKQAEILMVAAQLGRLSLSLRSLSDQDMSFDDTQEDAQVALHNVQALQASYTMDGEASQLLSQEKAPKRVTIIRGAEVESVSVGGNQ